MLKERVLSSESLPYIFLTFLTRGSCCWALIFLKESDSFRLEVDKQQSRGAVFINFQNKPESSSNSIKKKKTSMRFESLVFFFQLDTVNVWLFCRRGGHVFLGSSSLNSYLLVEQQQKRKKCVVVLPVQVSLETIDQRRWVDATI